MRGYGLPRKKSLEDIEFMPKTSIRNLPNKSGCIRSYIKNSQSKRIARRLFKRRARSLGEKYIQENL